MSKSTVKNLHSWQKDFINSPLNWEVDMRPLFDASGNEVYKGTFRSDNGQFIAPVTPGYTIVQNSELFKFSEELDESGEKMQFVKASEFNGGAEVCVRYKLPHVIDVGRVGDIVETELIVRAKHNGLGSVISAVNSKRLACLNGMITTDRQALSYVRHSASAEEKLTQARAAIGFIGQQVQQFGELCNMLADVKLSTEDIGEVVTRFYYKNEDSNIQTSTHKQNQARLILAKFEVNDGDVFKKQRGTAWNLLNSFTGFADHSMNFRGNARESQEQTDERGKLFGAGQALKFRALQIIASVIHKNHSINIPAEYLIDGGK